MATVGTWLTNVDKAILDYFAEHGTELPPTPTAHNLPIDPTPDHVGRRFTELEKAGLVETINKDGYRRITELGEKVANGCLSRDEINDLEPVGE